MVNKQIVLLLVASTLAFSPHAHGTIAFDSASDPAYGGGWTNGSNGGYGFGPWNLSHPSPSTTFGIGPSTANGDGLDDGVYNGVPSDGDIGIALRLQGTNFTATAGRLFSSGRLAIGQTFSIDFDNGDYGYETRYAIQLYQTDSSFNPVDLAFELFLHLGSFYGYLDTGFGTTTLIEYGTEGLRFSFSLTGEIDYGTATNYSYVASLVRADGVSTSWTGEVAYRPDYLQLEHSIPIGADATVNGFYVNNLSIVPEPSTLAILVCGAGCLWLRTRYLAHRARVKG